MLSFLFQIQNRDAEKNEGKVEKKVTSAGDGKDGAKGATEKGAEKGDAATDKKEGATKKK